MRVLGAILAGGQARRFGSDKALALLHGQPLIDHVAAVLASQVDALVVCGRAHDGLPAVADRPVPGLGPLGGVAGALHRAATMGFAGVIAVACDTPILPVDLVARLIGPQPAIVAAQPVIGWWPAALAPFLDEYLAAGGDRSLRAWASVAGARRVELPTPLVNVNTPADLAALGP